MALSRSWTQRWQHWVEAMRVPSRRLPMLVRTRRCRHRGARQAETRLPDESEVDIREKADIPVDTVLNLRPIGSSPESPDLS